MPALRSFADNTDRNWTNFYKAHLLSTRPSFYRLEPSQAFKLAYLKTSGDNTPTDSRPLHSASAQISHALNLDGVYLHKAFFMIILAGDMGSSVYRVPKTQGEALKTG